MTACVLLLAAITSAVVGFTNDAPRLAEATGPLRDVWPVEFRVPEVDRGTNYPAEVRQKREDMLLLRQLNRLQRVVDRRVQLRDRARWTVANALRQHLEDEALVSACTDEVVNDLYPTNILIRTKASAPEAEPVGRCLLCRVELPQRLLEDGFCAFCAGEMQEWKRQLDRPAGMPVEEGK